MTEFMSFLKNSYGYITDNQIADAIKELGNNYPVVVKDYNGERYVMSLEELSKLKRVNPIFEENIKEVFVSSNQYDILFQN